MPEDSPPQDPPERVAVGKLGRPHGIKGEIRLFLFNPASRTVTEGLEAHIIPEDQEGPATPVTVERARYQDDFVILKLAEIDDRGEVDNHKHSLLEVDYDDLPDLEQDQFYHVDIVGAPVFVTDEEDGEVPEDAQPVGVVDRLFATGANDVLVVDLDDEADDADEDEWFVPVVNHAVALLDFRDRRVVLQPPDIWKAVDYDVD